MAELYKQTEEIEEILRSISPRTSPSYKDVLNESDSLKGDSPKWTYAQSRAQLHKQTEEIEEILKSISPKTSPSYKDVSEKNILNKDGSSEWTYIQSVAELHKQTEEIEEILKSISPKASPSYKDVAEKNIMKNDDTPKWTYTQSRADLLKQTEEIEEILKSISPRSTPAATLPDKAVMSPAPLMSFDNSSSSNSSSDSPPRTDLVKDFEIMPVMMADTSSLEDQVAALSKAVEAMMGSMKARDQQMEYIVNKLENKGANQTPIEESSRVRADKGKGVMDVDDSSNHLSDVLDNPVSTKTMMEMIKEALKDELESK